MIYNSSCSATEVKKIGPLVTPVLPRYERKVDMLINSLLNKFSSWGIDSEVSGSCTISDYTAGASAFK